MPEQELAALSTGELVALAVGGGRDADLAWRLLAEGHVQLVWSVVRCFGLPKEASEEAYQSTWLRAVERIGTLRDPASFPGWLRTIARHEALAVIRARRKVIPSGSLPDQPAEDPPVGDRLQRDELCEAVRTAFASLPPRCRDLLRLSSMDPPIPYREIEELLEMSHGSIGPTRQRCLEKLRKTPALVAFLGVNEP